MYILTNKENEIVVFSTTLSYTSEGDYLIDEGKIIVSTHLATYAYEYNKEIPKEVGPSKYCYTEEKGFYKNPNYIPYYSVEDRVSALEDAVNAILEL